MLLQKHWFHKSRKGSTTNSSERTYVGQTSGVYPTNEPIPMEKRNDTQINESEPPRCSKLSDNEESHELTSLGPMVFSRNPKLHLTDMLREIRKSDNEESRNVIGLDACPVVPKCSDGYIQTYGIRKIMSDGRKVWMTDKVIYNFRQGAKVYSAMVSQTPRSSTPPNNEGERDLPPQSETPRTSILSMLSTNKTTHTIANSKTMPITGNIRYTANGTGSGEVQKDILRSFDMGSFEEHRNDCVIDFKPLENLTLTSAGILVATSSIIKPAVPNINIKPVNLNKDTESDRAAKTEPDTLETGASNFHECAFIQ